MAESIALVQELVRDLNRKVCKWLRSVGTTPGSQFSLTGKPQAFSSLLEGFARGTPYPLVYSFLRLRCLAEAGFYLSDSPDSHIWPFTPSSVFSVISTWNLCRLSKPRKDWSRWVWHASLPPRISLFVWRLLHKAISVDVEVQKRDVSLASQCDCSPDTSSSYCSVESLQHIFINSPLASVSWGYFGGIFGIVCNSNSTVEGSLESFHFPDLLRPPPRRTSAAELGIVAASRVRSSPTVIRWMKPQLVWVKLNIDGSARGNPGPFGGGGICRGDRGKFIFAFSSGYRLASNVYAELRAIHDSLSFCSRLGLSRIQVELDSSLAVDFLNETVKPS
ncbi:uncharacterized protein LOC131244295 [Magnolia sinica]|uniref:uncharacterized protein LOC131244295 n=1 Tax=Magnolia sinica TaxID=86752 RepID=UPI002657EF02|nr:uncharacterized protein LOC131244295 [Magnolia sinica]